MKGIPSVITPDIRSGWRAGVRYAGRAGVRMKGLPSVITPNFAATI